MGRFFTPRVLSWAAGLLIGLSLFVNAPPFRHMPLVRGLRGLLTTAVSPVYLVSHGVGSAVGGSVSGVVSLWGAQRENETLKNENGALKARLAILEDLQNDNDRLRQELGFSEKNPYHFSVLAARVAGRSPDTWFETVLINRGRSSRIGPEQAVVGPRGLVGRVHDVSEASATVLLLGDPRSAVSGRVMRTGSVGLVVGGAGDRLRFQYIPLTEDIQQGDMIVTSGISDVFPKGIPIGTVETVEKRDNEFFQDIQLRPAVNFSSLHDVFVARR